jgi:hypothetical protein
VVGTTLVALAKLVREIAKRRRRQRTRIPVIKDTMPALQQAVAALLACYAEGDFEALGRELEANALVDRSLKSAARQITGDSPVWWGPRKPRLLATVKTLKEEAKRLPQRRAGECANRSNCI